MAQRGYDALPMPPDAPGELAALRQLLSRLLPTSAQLDAFCARHFPTLASDDQVSFPGRSTCERLLARATGAEIRYRLALEQPAAVAQHTDYLLQVTGPTTGPRPLRRLPQRDATFTGRAEQLGELRGLLARHRAVWLTGPSGVGKTALASELLHRVAEEHSVVGLLSAATPELLHRELGELAQKLHEHGFLAADVAAEPAAVRDFLSRRADWLLVLDDVHSVALVESLLGPGVPAGHLLYTTQDEGGLAALKLGPLAPAESLQLLAQRSDRHKLLPGERLAVQRLAAALGYWPAALVGVADAVRAAGTTWIEALAEVTAAAATRAAAR